MAYAGIVMLGLLCIVNAWISWAVARTSIYTAAQKSWQIVVVWLLPIVGAVVVGFVLRQARTGQKDTQAGIDLTDQSGYPGAPDNVSIYTDAADIGGPGSH